MGRTAPGGGAPGPRANLGASVGVIIRASRAGLPGGAPLGFDYRSWAQTGIAPK